MSTAEAHGLGPRRQVWENVPGVGNIISPTQKAVGASFRDGEVHGRRSYGATSSDRSFLVCQMSESVVHRGGNQLWVARVSDSREHCRAKGAVLLSLGSSVIRTTVPMQRAIAPCGSAGHWLKSLPSGGNLPFGAEREGVKTNDGLVAFGAQAKLG